MSIIRTQGLQGLKGLSGLSDEARQSFMEANANKLNVYKNPRKREQAAEILFMNKQFKNLLKTDDGFKNYLGISSFDQINDGTEKSYNLRNQLFKDYTVAKAFKNTFRGDEDFQSLVAGLDTDGMYDLLNNEEYLGSSVRKQKLAEGIKAAKSVQKDYDKAINNPYVDALAAGYGQIGKTSAGLQPFDQDAAYAKKDKEILDKLYAETQSRREDAVEGATNAIYSSMLLDDESGTKSIAQSYDEFDKLATKNSPHYATFKNSKWLKDYSNEDKLKDYAKYQAIEKQYGQGTAMQYLDRSIQNRVAEAQDGSWTGNTLKGVLTTAWSDLGSNIALFANLGRTAEEMAVINQGKDLNKPIYDKSGQIVDYEKREDWLTNPAYWNNVYKYNTFSPTEIKAIEERGGISEDVNVRQYGDTPDFLSWETVEEGFKQGGHVLAGVVETGLTGAMGKAVGWSLKGALKGVGLSAKALQTASKVGTITNDLFVTATTGLEGSQLEAMGTFEESLQNAKEKIQQQINKELYDYSKGIDYNSKEAVSAIDAYYKELKKQDKQRVLANNREGASAFPLSDDALKKQAKQLYTNALLENKQKELQELHRKDELEAAKAATSAYGANFIMDYIKNIPLTTGIQKFKIAKGAMRGAFDNIVDKNIIADVATGGVKRVVDKAGNAIRYSSAKELSKEVVKQLGGGFADEYFDGINASVASGIGSNEFDNYIKRNYNPEAYNSTVDGMLGNLLAGFSEGISGLTDRQNLYEGFIGMVAPGATAMVNPNVVFSPKDTWKAVVRGTDANGKAISFAERMSNILTNPILNSIAEAKEKDRQLDGVVETINKVVADNKDKIEDASKIVSVLGSYNSPLAINSYNIEGEDGDNSISFIDSKDDKLSNCFTLITTLNGLESIQGGSKSKLYQDAMETIEGLANGNLSKEAMDSEIDRFLADEDNKSILDEENSREVAAERLQKNAQYFMDMKDKMSEVQQMFAKSPSLKNMDPRVQGVLMYNLVASEDYEKRLSTLEEELGVSSTDTKSALTPNYGMRYGTDKSKEVAVAAKGREISKIDKQQEKLNTKKKEASEKLESLKEEIKYTSEGEKIKSLQEEIKKQQGLLETFKFEEKTLNEKKQLLSKERDAIKALIKESAEDRENPIFTEEDILGLNAEDRAAVLNPENRQNYSKEQLAVIDNTISNLLQKDPEALIKVRDAGILASRISDLKTIYGKLLKNDNLVANYLNSAEYVRNNAAMAESIQRGIEEHYGKIEKAFGNNEELKQAVFATTSDVVEAYMEDHPEQSNTIQPYYEMLKFDDDVAAIISNSGKDDGTKFKLLSSIIGLQERVNSVEELKQKIEGIIDSPDVSTEDKEDFDYVLKELETMGYQRDATVVESREQRKQREEAARKAVEAEEEKEAEEARAAAKKAANEIAKKSQKSNAENDAKKNGANDNINPNGDGIEITEDTPVIDLEDSESPSDNTPNVETNNVEIDKKSQKETKQATNTFNVGDELILTSYDADGKEVSEQSGSVKVIEVFDNGGVKVEALDGAAKGQQWEISPNKVKQFFGEVKPFTQGAHTDITYNDRLGDATPYKENSSEENAVDSEKSSTFAAAKAETKGVNEMNKEESTAEVVDKEKFTVTEDGDIKCKEVSIGEMAADAAKEGIDVEVSDVNEDASTANASGEQQAEMSQNVMSGTAMGEHVKISTKKVGNKTVYLDKEGNIVNTAEEAYHPLSEDGILIHKRGAEPTDNMNTYFAWMEAAGIKLQNIVDQELGEIIRRNPHAKVKFMVVKSAYNATNDAHMRNHLMLVLDYDNAINKGIKNIHLDANGGVIKTNGKEYLVVGVVGYGRNNPAKLALRDIVFSQDPKKAALNIKKSAGDFFKENAAERFYVEEGYSTEVVPGSITPGYIVKQAYGDKSNKVDRPISWLLDPQNGRNPYGFTWETLAFGIQAISDFMTIRASVDDVMVPRRKNENLGNGFALVPAGNAKFVPVHFKALHYSEMNDGALKDEIDQLVNKLMSPNYTKRYEALMDLRQIFYFSDKGVNVLLSPTKPVITLVTEGGVKLPSFTLNNQFIPEEFRNTFRNVVNPRINITPSVLTTTSDLMKYDEAGALMTDVAMLATAGSTYSIYGVDKEGKMIIPEKPVNTPSVTSSANSQYVVDPHQVPFGGRWYHEEKGVYYLNGIPVTDADTIKQLEYNRKIQANKLGTVKVDARDFYYVMSNGEHPEVVKVDKNTHEVKVLSEESAKELLKKVEEEKSKKNREANAQKAILEEATEIELKVDKESGFVVEETQPIMAEEKSNKITEKPSTDTEDTGAKSEESASNKTNTAVGEDLNHSSVENLESVEHKENTKTFVETFNGADFDTKIKIMNILQGKWEDAPMNDFNKLSEFLKEKKINVDAIKNTKEDVEDWINILNECKS